MEGRREETGKAGGHSKVFTGVYNISSHTLTNKRRGQISVVLENPR